MYTLLTYKYYIQNVGLIQWPLTSPSWF